MTFEIDGRKCDTSAYSLKWDSWLGFNSTVKSQREKLKLLDSETAAGPSPRPLRSKKSGRGF